MRIHSGGSQTKHKYWRQKSYLTSANESETIEKEAIDI